MTFRTDNNEMSASEVSLSSTGPPADRSGDAVKIWNHIQVVMRGKRIICAPRELPLPASSKAAPCYASISAMGNRVTVVTCSVLAKGQRSTSEIPASANALTSTSIEDAAASSTVLA
jgi:hypothetical protein